MSLYGLGHFHAGIKRKARAFGFIVALVLGFNLLAAVAFNIQHWIVNLGLATFIAYAFLGVAVSMRKDSLNKKLFDWFTDEQLKGFSYGAAVISVSVGIGALLGITIIPVPIF